MTLQYFESAGLIMHEHKGCKKTKYVQSEWVTTVPDLLVFYYIPFFYSMSILNTLKRLEKQSRFTDIL
jgi:hypothetical protein